MQIIQINTDYTDLKDLKRTDRKNFFKKLWRRTRNFRSLKEVQDMLDTGIKRQVSGFTRKIIFADKKLKQ